MIDSTGILSREELKESKMFPSAKLSMLESRNESEKFGRPQSQQIHEHDEIDKI